MARKRMIDPGYWSDDKIIELEPIQRLLFIGMWNFADDVGVLKYSPKQIKARIFPADNITPGKLNEWLVNLHEIGLILLNEDCSLIKIKGWANYQKINRPQPSKYEFEAYEEEDSEHSLNNHGTITPNRIEKNIIEKKVIERSKNLSNQNQGFEQFYNLYPRKVQRQRATTAYKKLTKKEEALALKALPGHIKIWTEKGTEKDYIPHPASWLNAKSWEDDISGPLSNSKSTIDDYKLDTTGNARIGYCVKCSTSDFYDKFRIQSEDSRCCKMALSPRPNKTKRLTDELREKQGSISTTKSMNKLVGKYTN
jgi:hypothetical protein